MDLNVCFLIFKLLTKGIVILLLPNTGSTDAKKIEQYTTLRTSGKDGGVGIHHTHSLP